MKRRAILILVAAIVVTALLVAVPLVQADEPPAPEPEHKFPEGVLVLGEVAGVEDDQIHIETAEETWTVLVDEDTVIRLPGIREATIENIEVGKPLMCRGHVTAVGMLEASEITLPSGAKGPCQRAPGADLLDSLQRARRLQGTLKGQVASVGDDQLTLSTGESEVAVRVDAETSFRVPDVDEPTLEDIESGQLVVVWVPQEEDAAAKSVAIVTERQMRQIATDQRLFRTVQRVVGLSGLRGKVIAIEANILTLSTPRGELTLNVGEDTYFRIPDIEDASLSDVNIGDVIVVMGRADISCPINAIRIQVMPERPAPES